jgi:hypothetical protein
LGTLLREARVLLTQAFSFDTLLLLAEPALAWFECVLCIGT